nr:MAG TPA: hypothetical protein [Caudoviricetes sp.]
MRAERYSCILWLGGFSGGYTPSGAASAGHGGAPGCFLSIDRARQNISFCGNVGAKIC